MLRQRQGVSESVRNPKEEKRPLLDGIYIREGVNAKIADAAVRKEE